MGNEQLMLPIQRSRSNWIKVKFGDKKKLKFRNKRKSETLTLGDIMLNGETKDVSKIWTCYSKSLYTNREIKSITFLFVFLFSRNKRGRSYQTRLPTLKSFNVCSQKGHSRSLSPREEGHSCHLCRREKHQESWRYLHTSRIVKTNTKMSSLDSRQNLNKQENHDGGKGKGMKAWGHEGKRAKGQKPQTIIFPQFLPQKKK